MNKSKEKCCMRLRLIGELKIPTYEISMQDTFVNMTNDTGCFFLEDATIQTVDGWFIIEGMELQTEINSKKTYYNSEQIKKYRGSETVFERVVDPLEDSDEFMYVPVNIYDCLYLKNAKKVRYTFQHAVFKEFLEL